MICASFHSPYHHFPLFQFSYFPSGRMATILVSSQGLSTRNILASLLLFATLAFAQTTLIFSTSATSLSCTQCYTTPSASPSSGPTSTTSSTSATSTATTCPGVADGTVLNDSGGQPYKLYCANDYSTSGGTIPNIASLDACLLVCDKTSGCVAVTWGMIPIFLLFYCLKPLTLILHCQRLPPTTATQNCLSVLF